MSSTIQVLGHELPCTVEGTGPLVVFSYGLGKVAWGNLDRLKESHTLAVIDWPAAKIDREVQMSQSWFAPLVGSLGFDRAALCTWSMGSPAAIQFAGTNPSELSHLILVDPAGLGGKPSRPSPRFYPHVLMTRVRGRPTRGYVRMMWKTWIRNPAVDSRPLERVLLEFWNRPGVFRRNQKAVGGVVATPLTDLLAEIQVPTLILTGSYSTVLGPELAQRASAVLPRGHFEVFEQSAHTLQLEEPDLFAKRVGAFLEAEES